MSFIQTDAERLRKKASMLLDMGAQQTPLYFEDFCRLGQEVLQEAERLFFCRGNTVEEEAGICLALLMGYTATAYNYGDKEYKKEKILLRAMSVLDRLPRGLLKCQLLTYCYGEIFEKELAVEAQKIIMDWNGRELTEEETMIRETLELMMDNPYPTTYI